jgi:hypothetical protein
MNFVRNFLATAGLLVLMAGCEGDEACLSNQHAVQIQFLSAWAANDKDTTLNKVSLTGLLDGIEQDSIYRIQNLSELFMPLRFDSDTTTFILSARTIRDTIRFVHRSELDFISGECGYIFAFEIDTVLSTEAFIDSVAIDYPFVRYGESTNNIRLYIY